MEPMLVGILALLAMLALTFVGVPVAFCLAAVGVAGNALLLGLPQAAMQVHLVTWELGANFLMISIPLFIFMGQLVYQTDIASDLYDFVHKWVGRLPGGLAITATITSALFGAVTGSSVAALAALGAMVMPQMKKFGYNLRLATGSLSSAGTLAIMIPPSIPMVIYGIWTETSIGQLFIAGILPGILLTLLFCCYIWLRCLWTPAYGPPGPAYTWRERLAALGKPLPTAAIFVLVLGGIWGGVFTPTEASAIGAAGVTVTAWLMRRLTWGILGKALAQTGTVSAMIFAILVGGVLMSRLLVQTDVTPAIIHGIAGLGLNRYLILLGFTGMYLLLGCVLDTFGMLILTLPLVFPIVKSLGFDPVWFGIYMTLMMEVAMLTPPIGLNVFVMARFAPDVPMAEIFRGVAPFTLLCLVAVLLLTLFPPLALWLPATMK